MEEVKIELGKKYRDKVTGFEGTATALHQWLTGCATVSIQPKVNDKGEIPETQGFDVMRLELVEAPVVKLDTDKSRGGPHDTPMEQHR